MRTDFELLARRVYRAFTGNPQKAVRMANAGLKLALSSRDSEGVAKMLRARAHALRESGALRESLRDYDGALRQFRVLRENTEAWRTAIGKIDALVQMGRYNAALQLARRAHQYFQSHGYELWAAKVEANTGNIYQHLDRYSDALRAYQRAYPVLADKQPIDGNVLLFNQATAHLCSGSPDTAISLLLPVRDFFEQQRMMSFLARTYYNLAYAYYLSGKYQDALHHLQQARTRLQRLRDHSFLASCYLDEAELLLRLNQMQQSLRKARLALRKFRQLNMPYEAAECSALLAIALLRQDRVADAIPCLQRARKFFRNQNNRIKSAEIDAHLALAYLKQGKLSQALSALQTARTVFQKHQLPSRILSTTTYMAGVQMRMGKLPLARATLESARPYLRKVLLPWVLLPYHQLRGRIEMKLNLPQASESLEKAIRLTESIRSEIPVEDLRISFFEDKLAAYHSLILYNLRQANSRGNERAFLYAERARSRALLDLVEGSLQSSPRDSSVQPLDPLAALRNETWRRSVAGSSAALQTGKLEKELERNVLKWARGTQSSRISGDPDVFNIAELRSSLQAQHAVVSYFAIEDEVHAFVLDQERLYTFPSIARQREIQSPWHFLRFQLERARFDKMQQSNGCDTHLEKLFEKLLHPLMPHLSRYAELTIIPHGMMHAFPFHLLRDGSGYLCEKYRITYAPSCSIYLHCLRRKSDQQEISLFGVPDELAPLVEREIAEVKRIFPDARRWGGADAGSRNLELEAPRSRILHIASHGRFQPGQPNASGLMLSDGWFTVPRIYRLRMNAELVVMSGCETGGSDVAAGDEILGMVRGFLYAGAASIMVSLWRVSDESTSHFMREFYSRLAEGNTKPQAWQQAALRTRDLWPHPYYWGPFLLVGA